MTRQILVSVVFVAGCAGLLIYHNSLFAMVALGLLWAQVLFLPLGRLTGAREQHLARPALQPLPAPRPSVPTGHPGRLTGPTPPTVFRPADPERPADNLEVPSQEAVSAVPPSAAPAERTPEGPQASSTAVQRPAAVNQVADPPAAAATIAASGLPLRSLRTHSREVLFFLGLVLAGWTWLIAWAWARFDRTVRPLADRQLAVNVDRPLAVNCLAFHPNGQMLAAGTAPPPANSPPGVAADGMARCPLFLWRLPDRIPMTVFQGHVGGVTALAFSPDSDLVSAGREPQCSCWLQEWAGQLQEFHNVPIFARPGQVVGLWLGRDKSGWAALTVERAPNKRVLELYDLLQLRPLRDIDAGRPCCNVAFSADGRLLALVDLERRLQVWEVTGKLRHQFRGDWKREIREVAFSPDGAWVAAGTRDFLGVWSLADGRGPRCFCRPGFEFPDVASLAFSPDSRLLAAAGPSGIHVWRVDGSFLFDADPPPFPVSPRPACVRFSPDGAYLAVGDADGVIRFWPSEPATDLVSRSRWPLLLATLLLVVILPLWLLGGLLCRWLLRRPGAGRPSLFLALWIVLLGAALVSAVQMTLGHGLLPLGRGNFSLYAGLVLSWPALASLVALMVPGMRLGRALPVTFLVLLACGLLAPVVPAILTRWCFS